MLLESEEGRLKWVDCGDTGSMHPVLGEPGMQRAILQD